MRISRFFYIFYINFLNIIIINQNTVFFFKFSFIGMRAVCNAENNYGDKLIKENAGRIPRLPGSAGAPREKYQSISSAGERNAHSIFAYSMRIPNGHRRGDCRKIIFSCRARGIGALLGCVRK